MSAKGEHMQLLILGGTQFVGRHITERALALGHQVTLFHRGKTNRDLFPGEEKILGNRDGGLDALRGRTWDAVIDVNGYLPRLVRDSATMLRDAAPYYVYVSTLSVYAEFSAQGQTEDAPLARLADPSGEVIDGETYGGLKALCEKAVQAVFPGRNTMLRLGYV
jgi:2'-hydroxyisoflavone reductase